MSRKVAAKNHTVILSEELPRKKTATRSFYISCRQNYRWTGNAAGDDKVQYL